MKNPLNIPPENLLNIPNKRKQETQNITNWQVSFVFPKIEKMPDHLLECFVWKIFKWGFRKKNALIFFFFFFSDFFFLFCFPLGIESEKKKKRKKNLHYYDSQVFILYLNCLVSFENDEKRLSCGLNVMQRMQE